MLPSDLTTYFAGEKSAGLMLAGIGLAIVTGAALLFPARFELRSFSCTLGLCGLLQLAIGVGLYLKTGPQVERLAALLASDPAAFLAAERPRMAIVQRNFVYIEMTWTAIIFLSAVAATWFKRRFAVSGVALGLLLNCALLLSFDLIAERRGAIYFGALGQGAGPPPGR